MSSLSCRLLAIVLTLTALLPAIRVAFGGPSDSPFLSYVTFKDGEYHWAYLIPGSAETVLFSSKNLLRFFVWSEDRRTVLFLEGDQLRRATVEGTGADTTSLGPLPQNLGGIRALWTDRATGRIRLAAMAPVASKDVVRRPGGGLSYRSPEGRIITGLTRPNWGLPFIVTVFERDMARGDWSVLAEQGTKSAAGDTPGLSVISALRNEAGTSQETLLASYTCENVDCRGEVSSALAQSVSRTLGRTLKSDDLSLWRPQDSADAIVFRTVMGDTAHIATPVFIMGQNPELPPRAVAYDGRQIGLGSAGGLLLVEEEFTGNRPALVDLATAKTVWTEPAASGAVWVSAPGK